MNWLTKQKLHFIIQLIIVSIFVGVLAFGFGFFYGLLSVQKLNQSDDILEKELAFQTIQENSFKAIISPYFIIETKVLGMMVETTFEDDKVLANLVEKIVWCESKGNIEAENPSSTAYGLCQFLDGTWEYCEKKWEIELDRESKEDQLYACVRLLEEEGLIHWEAISGCLVQ